MIKEIEVCDHCGEGGEMVKTADGKDLCLFCFDIENRKKLFNVGSTVVFYRSEVVRDHGNKYTQEKKIIGKIVEMNPIETFEAKCLVEHGNGERTWVYIGEIESAD